MNNKATKVKNENLIYEHFAEWDLTMYRVLAFTGIRGGETLALTWNDVDFSQTRQ
ncbi:hypothetical protein [Enterococcus haemoperoxidus]|uniref:hypothetical protein n=1 Tax=Enterococcus haemoperoxidus TaxID=155618 RepID=UPI00146E319E|nr:hypothetical protein [Enterococcus haemoperoxidus]